MTISVTVEIILETSGEDSYTELPNMIRGVLSNSPARIWQHEIQGPTGGTTTPVDNYLLVPQQIPAIFLLINPSPVWGNPQSGATFILKGASSDVGFPISSYLPTLLPVATTNGGATGSNPT